jgi:phosphatidylglycerol:prolipoprotein diacylglycerol transferase
LGLAVGWFFGRLGCSIVHDHPGLPSDFILAVQYPTGPRHDLGFYEWLFTIGLIVLLLMLRRRGLPAGMLTGVVCVLYAPVRFMLDFLRVGDRLYYGFTPGQYLAVVMLIAGVAVLMRACGKQRKAPEHPP